MAAFLIAKIRIPLVNAVNLVKAGRGGIHVITNPSLQRLLQDLEYARCPSSQQVPEGWMSVSRDGCATRRKYELTRSRSDWEIDDVQGDGNCYFRVLALRLHSSEDRYMQVRKELRDQVDIVFPGLPYIPSFNIFPSTFAELPNRKGSVVLVRDELGHCNVSKESYKEYLMTDKAYAHDSVYDLADAAYPNYNIFVWEEVPQLPTKYRLSKAPPKQREQAGPVIDILCQRESSHFVSIRRVAGTPKTKKQRV